MFAVLGYKLISSIGGEREPALPEDRIVVNLPKMDTPEAAKWVKSREVDDLIVVYSGPGEDRIREFVDDHAPDQPWDRFVWPFAAGLSVILPDKPDPPSRRFGTPRRSPGPAG